MKRFFLFAAILYVVLTATSCAKAGDNTVRQAMQAYGSGQYETALQFFTQALNEDTNYSDEILYTFIANVYANQGEYEKAIEAQKKSLELRADYRGYVTLGMLCHLIKNDEDSAKAYRNAIALDEKRGKPMPVWVPSTLVRKTQKRHYRFWKRLGNWNPISR